MRRKSALAAVAAMMLGGSSNAWAQAQPAAGEGLAAFLRLLTERADVTFSRIPEVRAFFAGLVHRFDLREALLLVGIFVAGLAAVAGCKQGLGDRCQVDTDCDSNLVCVIPNNGTVATGGTCQATASRGLAACSSTINR